jgi:hypothetical protein
MPELELLFDTIQEAPDRCFTALARSGDLHQIVTL